MADEAPRLRDLLTRGAARLRAAGSETPELDASLLLAHLLVMDRAALYARTTEPAPTGITADFDRLIAQRAARVPVAYLVGTKEFMGLPFAVTPAVLVPRPETELLVAWAARWLQRFGTRLLRPVEQASACKRPGRLKPAPPHPTRIARVVDVGTGSGAIAVSLANESSRIHIVASDISLEALRVARSNAERNGVGDRVAFVCGNMLAWLGGSVDLVLANLPYLTDLETASSALSRGTASGIGGRGRGRLRALPRAHPAGGAPPCVRRSIRIRDRPRAGKCGACGVRPRLPARNHCRP